VDVEVIYLGHVYGQVVHHVWVMVVLGVVEVPLSLNKRLVEQISAQEEKST
jgi:hypothetical protein